MKAVDTRIQNGAVTIEYVGSTTAVIISMISNEEDRNPKYTVVVMDKKIYDLNKLLHQVTSERDIIDSK